MQAYEFLEMVMVYTMEVGEEEERQVPIPVNPGQDLLPDRL